MIIHNTKTGRVTFSLGPDRQLEMSQEEYEGFEYLIKHPPPVIQIKDPPKPWSPCTGPGCTHPAHQNHKTHPCEGCGRSGLNQKD